MFSFDKYEERFVVMDLVGITFYGVWTVWYKDTVLVRYSQLVVHWMSIPIASSVCSKVEIIT